MTQGRPSFILLLSHDTMLSTVLVFSVLTDLKRLLPVEYSTPMLLHASGKTGKTNEKVPPRDTDVDHYVFKAQTSRLVLTCVSVSQILIERRNDLRCC